MAADRKFSRLAELIDVNIARAAAAWVRLNTDGTVSERTASETVGDLGAMPAGTVAIASGGTGATTATGARDALGLGTGDSPVFTGVAIGPTGSVYGSFISNGLDKLILRGRNPTSTAALQVQTSYSTTSNFGFVQITGAGGTAALYTSANGAGTVSDLVIGRNNTEQLRFSASGIHATGNLTASGTVKTGEFTVGTLPSATALGQLIFVTDESGGAVTAFSDGTNWRRVTDRAIVS